MLFPHNDGRNREASLEPQRHIHESDEDGYFDEGADNRGQCRPGVDAKYRNSNGNREFEVVTCSREGKRGGFGIVRSKPSTHPEREEEHDNEVEKQRNGDAHHVEWEDENVLSLQREHHDDREEQGNERQGA